jgi:hypothetical protein
MSRESTRLLATVRWADQVVALDSGRLAAIKRSHIEAWG